MTKLQAALPFFILLPLSAFGQQSDTLKQDQTLRINQIQVIGSHNSYHSGIAPSERKLIEQQNPKAMRALDYAHAPLADQLTVGVRQLEIDIYADSKGGRYSHPAIVSKVAEAGLPPDPDFDPLHEMDKPGFKVMHVLDVDQRSSCHTLIACLTAIRGWSQQHPQHLPIFILVETKQGREGAAPQAHQAEPFTSQTFDALDAEISSVFSANEMITPDQVRGSYDTLPEAIQTISALSPTSKKNRWLADPSKRPRQGDLSHGPAPGRTGLYAGTSFPSWSPHLHERYPRCARCRIHRRERRHQS